MSKYFKSFTQPITQITDYKTGEVLSRGERTAVLRELSQDIENITALVEWSLRNDKNLLDDIDGRASFNNVKLAQELGVKLPSEFKNRAPGNSRYEHIYQDRVISEARSWLERKKASQGTSQKRVSQGWKRTADGTAPTNLVPKINLAAGAVHYAQIVNNPFAEGVIILKMVINEKWYLLTFNFDTERFAGCKKLTLPSVRVINGLPVFNFSVEYDYQYAEFTSDYVIGIDVGITNYATVAVIDARSKKIVHSTTLSQRVHSLSNSVRATARQVKYLSRAGVSCKSSQELRDQRASLSRKRRELAILAGQEIADLSFVFDNALVMMEDLSHISNTMRFGRWNRGALLSWSKHFVEQNGGRVYQVNAAYTSQLCSICGEKGLTADYHVFKCSGCGTRLDRDVNAASNVAQRVLPDTLVKTVATRRKSARLIKKAKRRTPVARESLRYSRRKSGPTPKQNVKPFKGVTPPQRPVRIELVNHTVMTDAPEICQGRTLEKRRDLTPSIAYANIYQE